MEEISVLNIRLPENVRAVTIMKNENDFCIFLNSFYDEKLRESFLNEELHKIKLFNEE